jgi:hypothetical protein
MVVVLMPVAVTGGLVTVAFSSQGPVTRCAAIEVACRW